jgi:tRNA A37 threonylcarbamoyladenosine modification protein TsaB
MPADVLGQEAVDNAATALRELPASLLALARARLAAGETDDAAELTPVYVALPRGVKRAAEDLGWSPDLR